MFMLLIGGGLVLVAVTLWGVPKLAKRWIKKVVAEAMDLIQKAKDGGDKPAA